MCSLRLQRDNIAFAVHLIREQPEQPPQQKEHPPSLSFSASSAAASSSPPPTQSVVHIVIKDSMLEGDATVRESSRHLSPLARATHAPVNWDGYESGWGWPAGFVRSDDVGRVDEEWQQIERGFAHTPGGGVSGPGVAWTKYPSASRYVEPKRLCPWVIWAQVRSP